MSNSSNQGKHQPASEGFSAAQIADVVEVARRAGVDLDASTCLAWIAAVEQSQTTAGEFEICAEQGIGGHELAVIDFDPSTLERLRRIGRLVAIPPQSGLQSALATSGSSAQGRIQAHPSDLDYFERVHFERGTIDEARAMLAELIRDNALTVAALPGLMLDEVYFGTVAGEPLRWSPHEILSGVRKTDSSQDEPGVRWSEAARNPSFIKLDWLLLDRELGGPVKLTKVIDATWSGAEGAVVSLDEAIDAEYQQIYLDSHGAELAVYLTADLPPQIRDDYVRRLERDVARYSSSNPADYAKVAKRLYNICRLTGLYAEAIFLRELFDEPPVSDAFRRRLFDFPPTATLLREIGERYANHLPGA